MGKIASTILVSATTFITLGATATPISENWTSVRSSYDVHAIDVNRFVLDDKKNGNLKSVAKFTVESGDVFSGSTGERSEVVLGGWQTTSRFRVEGNEGTEYYRVTVKLASDWKAPDANSRGYAWGIFFQLHGPNEYMAPPAVAIHAENKFSLFVLGGDLNAKVGGRRFLTKSDLHIGRWVDFILEIKWATDTTGAIAVYRRDEGESDWEKVADIKAVATLQHKGTPIPNSHYWKAGFYRSESKHQNSLWLGPILRGSTFVEVAG